MINFKKYLYESKSDNYQFKVGDRVVGTNTVDGVDLKGEKGTVKGINYMINVEWDRPLLEISEGRFVGHKGNDNCKNGHGWDVDYNHIKLIPKKISKYVKQLKFD